MKKWVVPRPRWAVWRPTSASFYAILLAPPWPPRYFGFMTVNTQNGGPEDPPILHPENQLEEDRIWLACRVPIEAVLIQEGLTIFEMFDWKKWRNSQ